MAGCWRQQQDKTENSAEPEAPGARTFKLWNKTGVADRCWWERIYSRKWKILGVEINLHGSGRKIVKFIHGL